MRPIVVIALLLLAGFAVWCLLPDAAIPSPAVASNIGIGSTGSTAQARLDAEGPGGGGVVPMAETARDQVVVVDPTLEPLQRVRVVDGDGQPIEDAEVEAFADSTPALVRTDREGFAVLPGPVRGDARRLHVRAGPRHRQAYWQYLDNLTIDLPWSGPLRGRVVDRATGAAIPHVVVQRHHDGCKHCEPDQANADADGGFELPAVPRNEECGFVFAAAGYARQRIRLSLPGKGESLTHTFALHRGVVVAGACVDLATRAPLEGVRVLHDGEQLARTAKDGSFQGVALPGGDGLVTLASEHAGYCRVTLPFTSGTRREWPLPRTGDMHGRVVARGGGPVAGARIRALYNGSEKGVPGMPDDAHVESAVEPIRTRSEADGTFRLAGLVPGGQYMLRAGHEDHDWPRDLGSPTVLASCVPGAPPVEIVLVRKPVPSGRGSFAGSFHCNGKAAAATLRWSWQSYEGTCSVPSIGEFRCENVPAGRVDVSVTLARFERGGSRVEATVWRGNVDVVAGQEARIDIVHTIVEATITGRVTFADGTPAHRVVVADADSVRWFAQPANDGTYVLRVPESIDTIRLDCGGSDVRVARPGATGVDFVVRRQGRLRLRVRADAGDLREPRYAFAERPQPIHYLRPLPAPGIDGFAVIELHEGEYGFLFVASGHVVQRRDVVVRAASPAELDVVLARGVAVTLRLHPAVEAAPSNLHLQVVDAAFAGESDSAWAYLDLPNSHFVDLTHAGTTLAGFGPGTHQLRCSDEYQLEPSTIQVDSAPVIVDVKWRKRPR